MESEINQQMLESENPQPLSERNREPLFECQFAYTKEVHRAGIDIISGNTRKNKIVLAIFCPIFLLAGILFWWKATFKFFGIFFVVFSIIMFLFVFVLVPRSVKSGYKKSCEIYGENRIVCHYFYDDYFISATANANEKHDYSKIGAIKENENLCALMLGNQKGMHKIGIAVNKRSFTKGDFQSFIQFIHWRTGLTVKFVK